MAKLERLLNLTATLLHTERPLTVEEIQHRVPGYPESWNSFRRTFERDKDELRAMDLPLLLERVPGTLPPKDGYRIRPRDYYLTDPGLEPDELAALHLAIQMVSFDQPQGDHDALWSLGGALESNADPVVPGLVSLTTPAQLSQLFGAVSDRRTVGFDYRGEPRSIDPYRIGYRRGNWYVTGHDHLRGEERQFRLDRIGGELDVGDPGSFTRPEALIAEHRRPWEFGDGEQVTARLSVDRDQAAWAAAHLGDDAVVERREDGGIVVELDVVNLDAFRTFVLGFLDHAEILEPEALRRDLIDWLEAVAR